MNFIYFNWKIDNKIFFIKYSSISKYLWTKEYSNVYLELFQSFLNNIKKWKK